mgnify:CR=1 FL=1
MKLNKTESALMERLNGSRFGLVNVSSLSGHGPEGGKVSEGRRERNAANKLVEKGLIIVSSHHSTPVTDCGYTIFVTDITYKLKD